jgi:hypothetical protein
MKLKKIHTLLNAGDFSGTKEYKTIIDEISAAIKEVVWPEGTKRFTLYDEEESNGVVPIKYLFLEKLKRTNWSVEERLAFAASERPGPIDAVRNLRDGNKYAVEWETGNISSSHRAINKMVLGLLQRKLRGGALIVPSREMYELLTDRVGNLRELEPYFPVWQNVKIRSGIINIFEVEHDGTSKNIPRIPKGTDGNAFRARLKRADRPKEVHR